MTPSGALAITTGLGTVELSAPIAWQEREGHRQPLTVAYALSGDTYGFTLGDYDPTLPVLIDPVLQSTYLGGSGSDDGRSPGGDGEVVYTWPGLLIPPTSPARRVGRRRPIVAG